MKAGENLSGGNGEGEIFDRVAVNDSGFHVLAATPDNTNGVVGGHLHIGLAGEFRDSIGGREKSDEKEKQQGLHKQGWGAWNIFRNSQPDCKFDTG